MRCIQGYVCVAATVVLATAATARAATINVNTTNTGWPTGFCSGPPSGTCCGIRQAIQAVNTQAPAGGCPAGNGNNDTVNLKAGTYTVTSSLTITRNVTLRGTGVGSTVLRGNVVTDSAFFWVYLTTLTETAAFEDLTLDRTSGSPFVTGIYSHGLIRVARARIAGFTWNGIINHGDDITGAGVTILDSTIENNSSFESGAGVQVNGSGSSTVVTIQRSTIANNTSAALGGGIYCCTSDNLTNLWNVTLSGNQAASGGGIAKGHLGYLQFKNVTIANNSATQTGGGVYKESFSSAFGIFGSIIGQNVAHAGGDIDGEISQMSDSLISDTLGSEIVQDDGGNLLNVWPDLDPVLRNLGGPYQTKVHRPFPGSPVIDRMVTDFEIPADQRNVLRPQFGGSNPGLADMGAFESSRLETETLTVAAKSSASHSIATSANYSNAKGTNLQAGGTNHFVTYSTTASLPAGTYNVVVGYKRGSNAGRFRFAVATAGGSFTNVGSVQEGYGTSSSWVSANLGNVTLSTNGAKLFRFTVTGKHGSSSSYQVFPDFVDFTRL